MIIITIYQRIREDDFINIFMTHDDDDDNGDNDDNDDDNYDNDDDDYDNDNDDDDNDKNNDDEDNNYLRWQGPARHIAVSIAIGRVVSVVEGTLK